MSSGVNAPAFLLPARMVLAMPVPIMTRLLTSLQDSIVSSQDNCAGLVVEC